MHIAPVTGIWQKTSLQLNQRRNREHDSEDYGEDRNNELHPELTLVDNRLWAQR